MESMLIVPVRVKKTSKHVGQGHFFITLHYIFKAEN